MAWQLIYTSAPRLLEAGRSGFGTVARHRAIHPLLVTALERDSQFDRAAAVAGRVIFAHRILTAAGSRFHVLTSIREAGADYTGRTNHIAHHLVIEPREIAALGSTAPNPADVFREMGWRTAWTEPPRWLEGADEIPLSRFPSRGSMGAAWQAVTGDARHAALLQPAGGAAITVPPGTDVLALFAESLALASGQAWQASLTTCLQQSDEVADFRWIALDASSPQRDRAAAGRTALDLTAPHSLPPPPAMAATSPVLGPKAPKLPPSSPAAEFVSKPIGNLFEEALAAKLPKRQEKRQRRFVPWILSAVAVVAIGVAATFLLNLAEKPEIIEKRKTIRKALNDAFAVIGGIPEEQQTQIRDALADKIEPDQLDAAKAIAEAGLYAANSLASRPLLEPRELVGNGQPNMPLLIGNLLAFHKTSYTFQERLTNIEKAGLVVDKLTQLRQLNEDITGYDYRQLEAMSRALREQLSKRIKGLQDRALDELNKGTTCPTVEPDELIDELKKLPGSTAHSEPAKNARKIVDDWRKIVTLARSPQLVTKTEKEYGPEDLRKLERSESTSWPQWLKDIVEAKLKPPIGMPESLPLAKTVAPDSPKKPEAKSAAPRFEGYLMVILDPVSPDGWKEFAIKLPDSDLHLIENPGSSGRGTKLMLRGNGFRRVATDKDPTFLWADGKFTPGPPGPAAPKPPYELFLADKAEVRTHTAWVPVENAPFRTVESADMKGIKRNGNEIRVADGLAQDLCGAADRWKWKMQMELPLSCSLETPQKKRSVLFTPSSLSASLEEITNALAHGITSAEQALSTQKEIANGKMSPNLTNAVAAINKTIDDDNKAREAREKKGNKQHPNEVDEIPRVSQPDDPKELGKLLKRYAKGRPGHYDPLFKAGEALLDMKGKNPVGNLDDAIKGVRTAREAVKLATTKGTPTETEKLRNAAAPEIDRLDQLEGLLAALKTEPNLRAAATTETDMAKKRLDWLTKHPLKDPGILPPGEYRLLVQPTGTDRWLTLVLFTVPKGP
jgi:hypothetical protein